MTPHVGVFPFLIYRLRTVCTIRRLSHCSGGFCCLRRVCTLRMERRSASLWRCSISSSVRREKTSMRASIVSRRALTRSKRRLMEWCRSRNSRSVARASTSISLATVSRCFSRRSKRSSKSVQARRSENLGRVRAGVEHAPPFGYPDSVSFNSALSTL